MPARKGMSDYTKNFISKRMEHHRYVPKIDVPPRVREALVEYTFSNFGDSTPDFDEEDLHAGVSDVEEYDKIGLRMLADDLEMERSGDNDDLREEIISALRRLDGDEAEKEIEIIGTPENYWGVSAHAGAHGYVFAHGLRRKCGDNVKLRITPFWTAVPKRGNHRRVSFVVRGKVVWNGPRGCILKWSTYNGDACGSVFQSEDLPFPPPWFPTEEVFGRRRHRYGG